MDKKQIANVTMIALAIVFVGASVASSKVKVLKKIKAGSITNVYLADNAVNSAKIEDGAVSNADLGDGSVTTGKISDGTISGSDLASDISISTSGSISAGNITADGTLKLKKYSSQPYSCDTSHDGALALNGVGFICECVAGYNWVFYQGSTLGPTCDWSGGPPG